MSMAWACSCRSCVPWCRNCIEDRPRSLDLCSSCVCSGLVLLGSGDRLLRRCVMVLRGYVYKLDKGSLDCSRGWWLALHPSWMKRVMRCSRLERRDFRLRWRIDGKTWLATGCWERERKLQQEILELGQDRSRSISIAFVYVDCMTDKVEL